MKIKVDWKYFATLLGCLAVRLLPFRAPNVEPVLAAAMPFAKRYGAFSGFLFGALSIGAYDALTGMVGMWTLVTAAVYGLTGAGAAWFFRNRESTRGNYFFYAVLGTLFYDALTGLTVGPLFFGQPLVAAALGQIPFTLLHLLGNGIFAVTVSPVLFAWIAHEKNLKVEYRGAAQSVSAQN